MVCTSSMKSQSLSCLLSIRGSHLIPISRLSRGSAFASTSHACQSLSRLAFRDSSPPTRQHVGNSRNPPRLFSRSHIHSSRSSSLIPKLNSRGPSHLSGLLKCSESIRIQQYPYATSVSPPIAENSPPEPQPYEPPSTGLLSHLPAAWVPYAELARIDKPAGSYYLFFPCLFSTLLAGSYTLSAPLTMLSTSALFAAGALVMRGAGCTINDLWDRNLDPHVARTRLRPLARRAVTSFAATAFAGAQCLVGLGILLQFPQECLFWGVPSLLLVGTYPLAKRVTHYPQFVLGLTFSWGAIMGFPALGVDLLADNAAKLAAGLLYASCTAWTVLYDMIYAHMDIKDDKIAGIKSIALKHEKETKQVLAGLAVVQLGLLAGAGAAVSASPVFFVGSCGGAALTLGTMIWRVQLKIVADCWWWFKYGSWFTGGAISLGMLAEYVQKRREAKDEVSSTHRPAIAVT